MEPVRSKDEEIREIFQQFISPKELKEIGDHLSDAYIQLYILAQKIVQNAIGKENAEETYVDIESIIKSYNINIKKRSLNSIGDTFINETAGFLDVYDYERGNYEWSILVNEELNWPLKRYVIAHEFSHFVINRCFGKREVKYCISPFFPQKTEEQICDIMASFFLMPITKVLSLFSQFIKRREEKNRIPADLYDWIEYLGRKTQVSEYHVFMCYQNIRYLGAALLNMDESRIPELKAEIQMVKEHKELFKLDRR